MATVLKVKSVNLIKNGSTVCISFENGNIAFLNTNFVKNVMEIPYTKKDGTQVSAADLAKQRAARKQRKTKAG